MSLDWKSYQEAELEKGRALKRLLPTAKNPCTHPKKLLALAERDTYFWKHLVDNPSTQGDALRIICNEYPGGRNYVGSIVQHKNVPADVLEKVLTDIHKYDRNSQLRFDILTNPNITWELFWSVVSCRQDWIIYFWEAIHYRFREGPIVIANILSEAVNSEEVTVEGILGTPTEIVLRQYRDFCAPEINEALMPFALSSIYS